MTEAIVLRTHYYDAPLDKMVRRLQAESGRHVLVAADERKGAVNTPPDVPKLTLDPAALGLFPHPDYGWRCGDYCLYAALAACPDATAFWLIEPDVRIHTANLRHFFDGTGTVADADFLTAWSVPTTPAWPWYRTIAPFATQPYTCMLQLCRFSRGAVEYLFIQRQALGRRFIREGRDPADWPNDEAFIGALLRDGDAMIASLQDHAPDYRTDGIFMFIKPTSRRWLEQTPPDNGIYHPVVAGRKFLDRARIYLQSPDHLAIPGAQPLVPDAAMKAQIDIEEPHRFTA